MTIPRSTAYLSLLCGETPPHRITYEDWPLVVCTELIGHGGDHTAHTLGDVDWSWPNADAPEPPDRYRWAWPGDEISHLT